MMIVFEGIDGCGKDTQIERFREWLLGQSFSDEVFIEGEPTQESSEGQKLHRLLGEKTKERSIEVLDQSEILDLYLSDRLMHSAKLRRLNKRGVVLVSRYDLSTYAYQSLQLTELETDTFFDETYRRHGYQDKQGCLIPDLTLFFDLSPKSALARIEKRGAQQGFEKVHVLETVRKNYLRAIDYLKKRDGRRILILDASVSVEELFIQVQKILSQELFKSPITG